MLIYAAFLCLVVPTLALWISPFNGTDLSHPVSLIKCNNQTRCVQPSLQLEKCHKVYYCGVQEYDFTFWCERVLHHPNIDSRVSYRGRCCRLSARERSLEKVRVFRSKTDEENGRT